MVARGGSGNPHHVIIPEENSWDVEFVKTPGEADAVVLWLIPKTGGLFGSSGAEIFIELSKNNIDVDYVNKLKAEKPTAVLVNFSNPWVISEIENENKTLLATFGTTTDALLDVLTGKFNPTGKLPVSIPASREAVLNNKADVPGYLEPDGYALFKFNDGISY